MVDQIMENKKKEHWGYVDKTLSERSWDFENTLIYYCAGSVGTENCENYVIDKKLNLTKREIGTKGKYLDTQSEMMHFQNCLFHAFLYLFLLRWFYKKNWSRNARFYAENLLCFASRIGRRGQLQMYGKNNNKCVTGECFISEVRSQ